MFISHKIYNKHTKRKRKKEWTERRICNKNTIASIKRSIPFIGISLSAQFQWRSIAAWERQHQHMHSKRKSNRTNKKKHQETERNHSEWEWMDTNWKKNIYIMKIDICANDDCRFLVASSVSAIHLLKLRWSEWATRTEYYTLVSHSSFYIYAH